MCIPALLVVVLLPGCSRPAPPKAPAPHPPADLGHLAGGRSARARYGDSRHLGIPHITAASTDDLFFAQGFVQAQDRLFQMDLWKRSVQGRLSEVLGANFIDRDAMTRRIQFRGDINLEWASYGADTRRLPWRSSAESTHGSRVRGRTCPKSSCSPDGCRSIWKPEDLLNRTDAFVASANAADDLFRARLAAAVGVARVDQLLPLPGGERTSVEPGIDLAAITFVVPETLRRVGTPPFFLTLNAPVSERSRPGQHTPVAGRA